MIGSGLLSRAGSWLARRFPSDTTTLTKVYDVAGQPAVPFRPDGSAAVEPSQLTVTFVNGRFRGAELAGSCVRCPDVRVTIRFRKLAELPAWAARYARLEEDDR